MMQNIESMMQQLQDDIEHNKIKLPTQPEIAVKIREIENDPQIDAEKIAKIIAKDPGLTARIIKIANSPLMRGKVQVDTLPNAINRLGFHFVCNTVIGLAMEQIFQATHETVDKLMYEVWEKSAEVAAYSHVIAKHIAKHPPEVASLAGLMHGVGVLPILMYAQDHDTLLDNQMVLTDLIKNYHPVLGEQILKSWSFPAEICNIYSIFHENKKPEGETPPTPLADIIGVAIDCYDKKHRLASEVKLRDNCYKKLGLDETFDVELDDLLKADLEAALKLYTKH